MSQDEGLTILEHYFDEITSGFDEEKKKDFFNTLYQ